MQNQDFYRIDKNCLGFNYGGTHLFPLIVEGFDGDQGQETGSSLSRLIDGGYERISHRYAGNDFPKQALIDSWHSIISRP